MHFSLVKTSELNSCVANKCVGYDVTNINEMARYLNIWFHFIHYLLEVPFGNTMVLC